MKAFYDGDEDVFLLNSDSWFCANLDRGEAFSIENKIILPREAIHTLNFMKRHNVESLLVIPYRFRGEVNGFILFERIENYFNWSKDELSLFNLFAEMLSSLKDRDAAYEMLHQDREKYQRLFLQLQEPFMLFDVLYDKLGQLADVRFIEINEQARLFLEKKGYGDIVGRSLLDVFSVEDLVFKNAMKNVIETGEPQTLSFNSMLLNCTMTLSYFVPQKGQLAILISHISESSEKGRKA
ncbi:MAG: GAF domain-containing protein [Aminobacterium sp.]|uniref:GAF domain-containing protein n=1 Tax=Aminobacterium sp. TaxID=1872491 RepID=UPI002B1F551E|nr:GAF domain-containing protein [Aminobacterium sp.]MEA4877353.1 GAF domain-containing protein [Aminobacterium sp.]